MRQEISVKRSLPVNLRKEDLPLFQNSLEETFTRLHPVFLKNAWIIQDTVFSPEDFKFYSSRTHIEALGPLQFAKRAVYSVPKSWRRIPKGMWIVDEWSHNYFHWITDCLPRIWEGLEKEPDFPVILPTSMLSLSYVVDSLNHLGVKFISFSPRENLRVDHLILTSRTAPYPQFNLPLVKKTRAKIRQNSTNSATKKVYTSRSKAPKRKVTNELEVEMLLIKRGFEIVHAENLSFKQQVQLMAETQFLVSLHGAALTNMIFLPDGAKVLELRNEGDSVYQCYFNLASALDIPYFYTLNKGSEKATILADFEIDLQALEQAVEAMEAT